MHLLKQNFLSYIMVIILACLIIYVGCSNNTKVSSEQISKSKNLNDIKNEVDKAISKFIDIEHFSGCVLIAKEGDVLFAKAYGDANKEFGIKNTIKTKFNIGSITKTFTAMAIMQFAENGIINVEDPIIKYDENFPFGDKITIFHLLTHTSGLGNYHSHIDFEEKKFKMKNISDIIQLIYGQEMVHDKPGEKFSYSNSGYVLLGSLIEKLSGKKYKKYIRENILNPLGLENTEFGSLEDLMKNRATGFTKSATGKFRKNVYWLIPSIASGGIQTTVEDLLKYDQALYTNKLLGDHLKQKMFTPLKKGFGLGWRIKEAHGNKIVYHGGETTGVSAILLRFLKDKYTVIVLSNYHRSARPVANTIEAILYKEEYEAPKLTLYEFLYQNMVNKGKEFTIQYFSELLKDNGYKIDNYRQLNMMANMLFDEDRVDMGIEILKLNATFFPNKPGIYWTLGEFYLSKGDVLSAIQSYKKALEVDPNCKYAGESLEEIRNRKKSQKFK